VKTIFTKVTITKRGSFFPGDVVYTNDDGKLHREDGPAVECQDGYQAWYINGVYHRVGGPAVIRLIDPAKMWYKNGKRHRNDGPAVEWLNKLWFRNGKQHRTNGPAFVDPIGRKEWWVNGKRITKESRLSKRRKWILLKGDIECVHVLSLNKEMQEYVLNCRPDLIGDIEPLHPSLKVKFSHELELSRVDL
jgi:hypothetical protein